MTASRRRGELTAAAARFTTRFLKNRTSVSQNSSWQNTAWDMYDTVPEVRFAASWVGNAMSGARLYAGRRSEDGTVEPAPDDHRATQLVSGIAGGVDGQAALLRDFGPHLVVPGEGWIIIRPAERGDGEDWRVLSIAEVKQQGTALVAEVDGEQVTIPAADPEHPPDDQAPVAIRVWQPHPRRQLEADSPVRSSLTVLSELQLLNAAVAAIARSRLTGRGVLLVPKGARFPTPPGADDDAQDDLLEVFMSVAETAYKEPESAAATVPIVVEVPPEVIGDIKWLTFESGFDELALKLRDEAIRRFAQGLEIPAEILLGLGDVNHWGVWSLSQEAIRLGIAPRLAAVSHALTTQWLRPLLQAEDVADADEWLVWYDTAPLRVQAQRPQVALEVYDRGAISAEALRRETGFDDADAPTPGEVRAVRGQQSELPVGETGDAPDTLPASAVQAEAGRAGLLAAADGIIWAALASAGEKIVRTPACPRSERARAKSSPGAVHTLVRVDPHQVEQWKLLDGAWTRVPEVAARYGVDASCLTAALDTYTRELITAGVPHEFELVPGALGPCADLAAAA